MNTTYRCALTALLAFGVAGSAAAQSRTFPQNTLRGAMVFGEYPNITLNGKPTSLVPGSRVRNQQNMIVPPATLTGPKWLVHYTLEMGGEQVHDVWLLSPDEAAIRPWPTTLGEAQAWSYDPATFTWTKP